MQTAQGTQPATPRLSTERVAAYQRDGYLLFQDSVFPAQDFKRLKALFEELLARWPTAGGGRTPEHMDVPHFSEPRLFEFLLHPAILDLVEPIVGPDIALWSSHFICKPPFSGKRVPWHEDSAYWKGRLDPMDVVTVWLAIDPSDPGNGCMSVIPGTHRDGYSEYEAIDRQSAVFDTEIRKGAFDDAKAVPCILDANQCSLHHAKLIHGSQANTSARRRCGYTMRYMSTATRFDPTQSNVRDFSIYLARGQDRAGNRYGDPGRALPGWAAGRPFREG